MTKRDILFKEIEKLPESQIDILLNFIHSLLTIEKGISGNELLRFAGVIPSSDLEIMAKTIEDGCERINPNEW